MAFEADWLELFNRTITIEAWSSEDSGGHVTYGAPATYPCYINDDVKTWKWEKALEQQSRRMIYVHGETIGHKDKITLPAGYEPQVVFPVWMVRKDDDEGYHHTEIYL